MTQRSDEEKKLLNEVLPNVAAQMRGPLSVLHASLQKMIQTDMSGTALLNQSYYQLLRLAGNLSMAELLDGEHYLRKRENGDIVVFCRELAEQVGLLAEEQGVTVQFSCAAQSCVIAYDAHLMERLLLNLFSNALKFTDPGGKVTLTVQVHKSDVLLSVEDTGCGMAPEMMSVLFDRYLHSERMDPRPHGLGLGLPLCRAIAEAHGGRIFGESKLGKGTKITVSLPNERGLVQHVRESFDYAGGFDHVLLELSDALNTRAYERHS